MSTLAQQHQTINLSQDFPDFGGPHYLQERLAYHIAQGASQYALTIDMQALREAIAQKAECLYGYQPDADSDITVTVGAMEVLYAATTTLVRNGDEVICLDPSYDSYSSAIVLSGGIVKCMALQPPYFCVDWQEFVALLNERTRLVILNTPYNPSATVWQQAGFAALWQAIAGHEIFAVSDEAYEHINFSQQGHASVLAHPQLHKRAVAVPSFDKTYYTIGWKVNYCVVSAPTNAEIRKTHQYLTFSVNTLAQLALADMLRAEPEHYLALPDFYRQKRDILVNALNESWLEILPRESTYLLLADYNAISTLGDIEFCQ